MFITTDEMALRQDSSLCAPMQVFFNLFLICWMHELYVTGPPVTSFLCINTFSHRMFFYTQLRLRPKDVHHEGFNYSGSTFFSDLLMVLVP